MQKYAVEFIGTLFFLFTIIATANPLAIISALYLAIMLGGGISGAHFNPAVSVMKTFSGELSKKDLPAYLLAQLLGGLSAYYLYYFVK
jgi:glycerol uptake facilitator-like aquaporin